MKEGEGKSQKACRTDHPRRPHGPQPSSVVQLNPAAIVLSQDSLVITITQLIDCMLESAKIPPSSRVQPNMTFF